MMSSVKISAIETYLPKKVMTNELLQLQFPELKLRELTRLTGVEKRHIAQKGETAADIAFAAAQNLYQKHPELKGETDFIIFCSAGGDYITPASACVLQNRLGLSQHCGAFDFNQGCTGYLYGLNLAKGLIVSGTARNVLLLTAEAITNTIHPADKSNRAIFGDGATASMISAAMGDDTGIGNFVFGTDGSHFEDIIIRNGRERYPLIEFAEPDFSDNYGNVRNHACFHMNGSAVFQFSVNKAPELVYQVLDKNSLNFEQVNMFIFHQANRVILETIAKKLKLDPAKNHIYLSETGNTVASTIPFAIHNALEKNLIQKDSLVLLAGFGVGFSWGGTVVRF